MATERPDYDATAVRPPWATLPQGVRSCIESWLGVPVSVAPAGGGFTGGFAATLTAADGTRAFVKAVAEDDEVIAASYRREIAVHAALPATVPAPRLIRSAEVGGQGERWVVLVLEHRAGRMPGMPWTDADLALVITSLEQMALSMRDISWDDDASLSADASGPREQEWWSSFDASRLPADLADWVRRNRERLAHATAHAPGAFRGDAWIHGDIRADNLILDEHRAWMVDWNWLTRAAAWVDLGLLLPQVHADGVDLAPAFESSLLAEVAPEDLDAGLAWLAALMAASAVEAPFPGSSPALRPHQRWFGEVTLDLLRSRWGG